MKALQRLIVLSVSLWGLTASAQQKFKCQEAFTAFEVKVNAGDFPGAFSVLPELRKNCRGFNEKLYIYGETLFKSELETANAEEKKVLINDLSALYSEYDKYYPQSEAAVKKAMLLHENKLAKDEEVFAMLDAAFASKRAFFNDPNALEAYFLLYQNKFLNNKEAISVDQFVEKYADVSAQIRSASAQRAKQREELLNKQETQALTGAEKLFLSTSEATIETLAAVGENTDMLASKHMNCNNLEAYFDKHYEANKADTGWLEAMVNSLLDNKCYTSSVLLKGATALHQAHPTTQSAFNLGSIALRKNDIKGAVTYYEESAQLEPNQKKKADLYYRIASVFRNSDKAAAKKYVLQAAQLNPAAGKPFIFLAELYSSASKECGLSPFEQKALTWLAIETLKKAEAAESKYKPTVASMIEGYNKRLPSKEEISGAGKRRGDKITYGCWINETVTIPNNK